MAILKPFPLSESIFSTGTLVLLKKTCLVDEECIPNLDSSLPSSIPFSGLFSTMKALIFLSFSILAKTVRISANPALEIHIF